jgi:cation diffusion facilitator CzcD-associated flavoprotein CzcO
VREGNLLAFTGGGRMRAIARRRPAAPRRAGARPGAAREATPDYDIGCKRVLVTNDYYRAHLAPTSRS